MKLNFQLKKIDSFLKNNVVYITLGVSLFSLGVGLLNTYELKNGVSRPSTVITANVENLEKILEEIPENSPVLGDPDAKLTIVEFSDFQCPYCGRFFTQTFPEIKKQYIDTGKVKFVYLDFAFLGPESVGAAEAAKCAAEQGKFWEYHDEIFNNQLGENQGGFNAAKLKNFAKNIRLNIENFDKCVSEDRYSELISSEQALGRKYGITGTPGFIIGNQFVKGANTIDYFKQIIDSQL